jgi:hypothetical protein
MGLAGLVAHLEERLDARFDFSDFDTGGMVSVRNLIQHCISSSAPLAN